ncbi:hypothetical protein CFAM422_002167 [Trichoderma lentiforme]|uniref:Uncharacterized protein n=1 Tax=Trichoderma lentiforme TaxID=1567552 RepID=A0A9P4XNG9_9HYPO|nr:hypothetical protein CFAM422_002167 [Trichoderma lentiforme]
MVKETGQATRVRQRREQRSRTKIVSRNLPADAPGFDDGEASDFSEKRLPLCKALQPVCSRAGSALSRRGKGSRGKEWRGLGIEVSNNKAPASGGPGDRALLMPADWGGSQVISLGRGGGPVKAQVPGTRSSLAALTGDNGVESRENLSAVELDFLLMVVHAVSPPREPRENKMPYLFVDKPWPGYGAFGARECAVESHHRSSSVQTEQRIEGEKKSTRPVRLRLTATSNITYPPSPRRSHSKPSPAQPSPSLTFAAPCSLSRTTSNPKIQPVPVLIGRPSSMAILGSRSLRATATPYLTAADGCLGRGSRYMCRPVMGLGGCETLPSWSQTASPLTGRPVNTTCNFAAERQKERSACMAWSWMQPPIRDATGTARNALAERAPIGHPLSGQYHESIFLGAPRPQPGTLL